MANDIGSVKGVSGSSMSLNTSKVDSATKPAMSSSHSPGGTKPPKEGEKRVPLAK